MKMIFVLSIGLLNSSLFAKTVNMRKIDDLEKRVAMLEKRMDKLENSSSATDQTTGLKVKDYQGTTKALSIGRGVASPGPSLTKEQTQQIQNTIEQYKKNKAESDKILDQIMNEDF